MIRIPVRTAAVALLAALAGACARGDARPADRSDASQAPPASVDSVETIAGALQRFRADLPAAPTQLGGAYAASRDSLVARFVAALERADTAALEPMALDRAEFAYLYYETNPQSRPPYELPPSLMWFQLQGNNRKGALRAMARFGGRPLGFRGYTCAGEERQGPNLVHTSCTLRLRSDGGPERQVRLFGAIIERDGRFKVLSYANDL